MKYTILLSMLILSASVSLQAQTTKMSKGKSKYLSNYDSKTLTPDQTPVLLPYNRWIDPAGEQILFGVKELENHALDLALSPDEKWLAIEGRYEVVMVATATKKIVATLQLSNYFKNQIQMNSFSGICWRQEGDLTQLFWGAGGKDGSGVAKAT